MNSYLSSVFVDPFNGSASVSPFFHSDILCSQNTNTYIRLLNSIMLHIASTYHYITIAQVKLIKLRIMFISSVIACSVVQLRLRTYGQMHPVCKLLGSVLPLSCYHDIRLE